MFAESLILPKELQGAKKPKRAAKKKAPGTAKRSAKGTAKKGTRARSR